MQTLTGLFSQAAIIELLAVQYWGSSDSAWELKLQFQEVHEFNRW